MGIRKYNPVTPGTRFKSANTFEEITKSTPEKSLLAPIKKSGGRNNSGNMTCFRSVVVIKNVTVLLISDVIKQVLMV